MTTERKPTLRNLIDKASPQPWHERGEHEVESAGTTVVTCGAYNEHGCSPPDDRALIVAAVNALPGLLDALETIAYLGSDAPAFGGEPEDFYRNQLSTAIGTAARALRDAT